VAADRICLGVILGAHGVRGDIAVRSFAAVPADLVTYGPLGDEAGARSLALTLVRAEGDRLIVRAAGIADRDAAAALKGMRLHVARAALPEPAADEFYHSDLIGLAVRRTDGQAYGAVRALHDFGAGPVIEIERADGARVMLPFTLAVVPVVDIAGGHILVDPPAELDPATAARGEDGPADADAPAAATGAAP